MEIGRKRQITVATPVCGSLDLADIDRIPRPVVAVSAVVSTRWEQALHQHRKGHLIYSVRGVLNCEIEKGAWIVPPNCAIWIPGDTPYSARGAGQTETNCLYVEPDAAAGLPKNCCTLAVSPLMRELLFEVALFPDLYPLGGREERTVSFLLEELSMARAEGFYFPMPSHPRLRQLAGTLRADPADDAPVDTWAKRIGMSERTMTRLLRNEIGMSFGRWRRQLHVVLGLQLLSQGDTVQAIALQLGYESASGFVTMFRKAVGKPPAKFMADCRLERGHR
jgi:AraC-like DNA-binding protein